MDRRGFLITTSATLGTSTLRWREEVEAGSAVISTGRRRVTPELVGHIDQRLDHLRHLDDALGGGELRDLARAEFALITRLLRDTTYDEATGRRLYAAACEASRICAWLHFDAGFHAVAQRYFGAALRASATAGDVLTGAYAMSFQAIQCYTIGDPRDAVNLLDAARTAARAHATPTFTAMLAARAARAHSKTGEFKACAHALHEARGALEQGPRDEDPACLYWVNLGEIEMIAGSSALELGDPAEAVRRFDAAIAADYAGDEQYPRTHAIYLARTAEAHLMLRDYDQAVGTAGHAVRCLGGVDSARSTGTLTGLRGKLTTHRDVRVVSDFLDLTA